MEKRDARLFQQPADIVDQSWNIVELESRRQLRRTVSELIALATSSTITTSEMQQYLLRGVATHGNTFATQLVRSLQRDNQEERQSIVWLLTLLNDEETLTPLQQMALNKRLSRSIRLSASLVLAALGATRETQEDYCRTRLYAIG
ncbi:MAG: hypothetical protein ABI456_04545 [Ktedonobacteraceae bacterium]|nr:hypothetical protein [Chloroflexota bacterium]